jgi:5-methylcytosine-specific restriction endonuclease McrA
MSVKACSKCGEVKPLDGFSKARRRKDGLQAYCKACNKAYYESHKEKILVGKQTYRQANNEKVRAHERAYREANRQNLAARQRAFRKANPEKITARNRAYAQANPKKFAAAKKRRRARKANNGVYLVTNKEMARLYASSCAECGSTERIEADHVVPISRGGHHSIGNLQPLCRSCNASKFDRLQVEWRHAKMQTLAA